MSGHRGGGAEVWPGRVVTGLVSTIMAGVVAATAVGFWLSYGALHRLALDGGLRGHEAWAWPASVDLFILVGELGLTLSYLFPRDGQDWWSWAYVIGGAFASVSGNELHVDPAHLWWLPYAVSATPPLAATGALAAALRQVHRLLNDRVAVPAREAPKAARTAPAPPPRRPRAAAKTAAATLLAAKPDVTADELAAAVGRSPRTARRYLRAARREATADA